jgi:capsular exopolysaccharide synthesis family protein
MPPATAGQLAARPAGALAPVRVPEHRTPHAIPAAISAAPTVPALMRAFKRCWLPATLIGLLCGVVAAGVAWVLSPGPKFTALSVVEMPEKNPKFLMAIQENRVGLEAYQRIQLALVKSRGVLKLVLDDPEVKKLATVRKKIAEEPDPIQWLEREVHADFNRGPEILRISMNGENGDELLKLVNALTRVYVAQAFNKEAAGRTARLQKLREFQDLYEKRLDEKQKALKSGANGGAGDKDLLIGRLPVLQIPLEAEIRQLELLQNKMRELEVRIAHYQAKEWSVWPANVAPLATLPQPGLPVHLALNGLAVTRGAGRVDMPAGFAPVAESVIAETIDKQENVKKALAQVDHLEKHVAYLIRTSPPTKRPPSLSKSQQELVEARKALAKERDLVRGEIVADLWRRGLADARNSRLQAEEELRMLRPLAKLIQHRVELLRGDDQKLDVSALGAGSLRRQVETIEGILKTIQANIDDLDLQQQILPRDVPPEEAVLYRETGKTRQLAITGMAGAGSLGLVVLGFSWWEFRRRRVSSPDEVVHGLGMRLVGALPDFAYRHRRVRLLGRADMPESHWQNLLAASVDSVRTTLLHAEQNYGVRVVVITSAVAGEGKTSLSCHLAASLDRAGRRTLLIDADMRAATAHRLFDLRRSPGFSEVLRGEVTLEEAIQPTPVGGLAFLAAGRADPLAIQMLAQPRLAEVLRQIRGQFDFVLIDSCPVLPVADALLMGQHADAVIFSVLRDISRLPKVHAAYQRVGSLGIPILGAVVSGARDELYAAGYHYAYAADPADDQPAAEVQS